MGEFVIHVGERKWKTIVHGRALSLAVDFILEIYTFDCFETEIVFLWALYGFMCKINGDIYGYRYTNMQTFNG